MDNKALVLDHELKLAALLLRISGFLGRPFRNLNTFPRVALVS
jgi:hypothetical protein